MDDAERFTEIFRTFHPPLTAYARRRVPSHVVEDVVAAVFSAAWRHLGSLTDEPLPWLYRAAFFEVAAYRRKERQLVGLAERLTRAQRREPLDDIGDLVASAEHWRVAFRALTEADQEVLMLVAWERLAPRQCAAVLGCSVPAFRVRLSRARRRLEAITEANRPRPVTEAAVEPAARRSAIATAPQEA